MNATLNQARVAAETLTDGSIVFNVVVGGEAIACPASMHEAEALCEKHNQNVAAYQRYVSMGFADTDGHFAPIPFEQFSKLDAGTRARFSN